MWLWIELGWANVFGWIFLASPVTSPLRRCSNEYERLVPRKMTKKKNGYATPPPRP